MTTNIAELNIQSEKFAQRVSANQTKLTSELKPYYDFIVCGSGSSGSVVARRHFPYADAKQPGIGTELGQERREEFTHATIINVAKQGLIRETSMAIKHHHEARRGAPLARSYDYVIVGAGSAGCVVARRLVEGTDATVLLLEAGAQVKTSPASRTRRNGLKTWARPTTGLTVTSRVRT